MPIVPTDLLPADATWTGVLLILIGGLFLAAVAVGVATRAVMPEHYENPTTTIPADRSPRRFACHRPSHTTATHGILDVRTRGNS